jgi:hypothetical protein
MMNTQTQSEETKVVALEESHVLRSGGFSLLTLLRLRPDRFLTEASEQGWAPGFWPQMVGFRGEAFVAEACESSSDGEFLGVQYRATSGRLVTVLND